MEDGGRLAPMSAELVDRLAILVDVRRFPCMGAADSRSLRSDSYVAVSLPKLTASTILLCSKLCYAECWCT
jgi:hypothetical protein